MGVPKVFQKVEKKFEQAIQKILCGIFFQFDSKKKLPIIIKVLSFYFLKGGEASVSFRCKKKNYVPTFFGQNFSAKFSFKNIFKFRECCIDFRREVTSPPPVLEGGNLTPSCFGGR